MLSGGRLWGRQANVNSPASGSGPLITAGWHTLVRVWDGREVRQYVDGLRTNTTAVTATGSWPLYRFGYQFTGRRGARRGLRAVLRCLRRRLGRRDGRPLECQSARHALAGDGCGIRDFRWWGTASHGATAGGHHCGRVGGPDTAQGGRFLHSRTGSSSCGFKTLLLVGWQPRAIPLALAHRRRITVALHRPACTLDQSPAFPSPRTRRVRALLGDLGLGLERAAVIPIAIRRTRR